MLRLFLLLMLVMRILLATLCCWFGSWGLVIKLNLFRLSILVKIVNLKFRRDFEAEVWSVFCCWCLMPLFMAIVPICLCFFCAAFPLKHLLYFLKGWQRLWSRFFLDCDGEDVRKEEKTCWAKEKISLPHYSWCVFWNAGKTAPPKRPTQGIVVRCNLAIRDPRFCNKANYARDKHFHFLTKLLALVVASPCLLSGTLDIGNTLTSEWAVPRPFKEKEIMLCHAKHFCN